MTSSAWAGLMTGLLIGAAGVAGVTVAWPVVAPPAMKASPPIRKRLPPPVAPPTAPAPEAEGPSRT